MKKIVRTVCPRNCYDACAMLATVQDGRLVKVEGDPDGRVTRGALCPRGARYVERTYHPDRLLTPMLRVGEPGSDDFEPISWEEAIQRTAEALAKVRAQDPRGLLHYAYSGHNGVMTQFNQPFLSAFGGCSQVYGDLCWPAGLEAMRLTFGEVLHHPPEDYLKSEMIVLWGKNARVTSPHQMRFIREAKEKGAHVVCIDPVQTRTAKACTEHLAPKPGTDGFLANAIGHIIVSEEFYDRDFVSRHVEGFDEYSRMVRQYEPAKAAEVCGITKRRIVNFARKYATSHPANINAGFGLQRYRNGGQTIRSIAALQVILGNIGVPGGGFDYANETGHVTRRIAFPSAPPKVRQLGPISRLGRLILKAEQPRISAALIERANPMSQNPFSSAVHYALTRLDFLCVIDQFLTDTARRAHIVLPAKTMFEELDVHPGYWHGMLLLKEKVIEPPGEVRTEREIYRTLAEAMGFPTHEYDVEPEKVLNSVLPHGMTVETLRKGDYDPSRERVPFADRRFKTMSGKIELLSKSAEISWGVDSLPYYTPPRESEQGDPEKFKRFPLQLITPKSEFRQLSQWGNDPKLHEAEGTPGVHLHPDEAKRRSLTEGDAARVYNDRGQIKLPVRLDRSVRTGVAMIRSGAWLAIDGFSVNVLTHDDVTDMGHGGIFYDCLVEVEAAPANEDPEEG